MYNNFGGHNNKIVYPELTVIRYELYLADWACSSVFVVIVFLTVVLPQFREVVEDNVARRALVLMGQHVMVQLDSGPLDTNQLVKTEINWSRTDLLVKKTGFLVQKLLVIGLLCPVM